MIQKKLNNNNTNNKIYNSLLLYVVCIISILTMNLVNINMGFGMEQQQVEQVELNNQIINNIRNKGIAEAVIEELRQIEGSDIFNEQFNEMLKGPRDEGDMVIAARFADKSEPILKNLYTNNRNVTLNIARKMIDLEELCAKADNNYTEHEQFFKYFNQIFYHSKRLLNTVITPQLADIYLKNIGDLVDNITKTNVQFNTQIEIDNDAINGDEAELITKQTYDFLYNSNVYKTFLRMKSSGLHFGGE